MSQPAYWSSQAGNVGVGSSFLDNVRRRYDFESGRLARLNPDSTLFYSYLAALRRVPTPDPKFMFLEQRNQWQRRNFEVAVDEATEIVGAAMDTAISLTCQYDKYGRVVGTDTAPEFFVINDNITIQAEINTGAGGTYVPCKVHGRVTAIADDDTTKKTITFIIRSVNYDTAYATTYSGKYIRYNNGQLGQVGGSGFAEGTGAPEGWVDQLYDREGYTQIFKTSIPVVSGTAQATVYRGLPDELARIWGPKLDEHKMGIAQDLMFGVGRYAAEDGSTPVRYTWGLVPYVEQYGTVETFSYATTGYNQFLEFLRTFLAPEKGMGSREIPLVMTSRKILGWLNKFGSANFIQNTFSSNPVLNYETITGQLGHQITMIKTIWGTLAFGEEVLMRGMWEDYAVLANMNHLAYRPLVGNGENRDTFVTTNVQGNDIDGRKDMILTEAGLQIDMPEKHAILKFS